MGSSDVRKTLLATEVALIDVQKGELTLRVEMKQCTSTLRKA